jgi:hypothetical protein
MDEPVACGINYPCDPRSSTWQLELTPAIVLALSSGGRAAETEEESYDMGLRITVQAMLGDVLERPDRLSDVDRVAQVTSSYLRLYSIAYMHASTG